MKELRYWPGLIRAIYNLIKYGSIMTPAQQKIFAVASSAMNGFRIIDHSKPPTKAALMVFIDNYHLVPAPHGKKWEFDRKVFYSMNRNGKYLIDHVYIQDVLPEWAENIIAQENNAAQEAFLDQAKNIISRGSSSSAESGEDQSQQ